MTIETKMFKAGTKAARESLSAGHIPGVAIVVWLIWMAAAALAALWLGSLHIADAWIGVQVVGFVLVSLLFLYGIKVADQWEKAVVLRFGKFDRMCFLTFKKLKICYVKKH